MLYWLASNQARLDMNHMATWHQMQARKRGVPLYHQTKWTVLIDSPGQFSHAYICDTKALAEVYMRNLEANNPGAAKHAVILRPAKEQQTDRTLAAN